jgi:hypothetical protein
VGGMNKIVVRAGLRSIDQEIERLRRLTDAVASSLPGPPHPPTARWENVQYYWDRLRRELNVRRDFMQRHN